MFKRLVIAIVLLGLIVGGIVWFNGFRARMTAEFLASQVPPPVPVNSEKVEPVTWRPGIDAVGTAISKQGVDLSVESGGLVRALLFNGNDTVAQGQQLVQIDAESEKAALAAAEAELNVAIANANRARTLSERGVSAATALEIAEADVESARAQVAQVQTALDRKRTVAPFDGIIGIQQIDVGQWVATGTVFANLQDPSKMRVDFSLPEQQLNALSLGGEIIASSEVEDVSVDGRIIAIEPRVDPNSRLVSVRAEIDNTGRRIVAGQFLRVRVVLPAEEGVIAVPQTAIDMSLFGNSIFVMRREGEANADKLKEDEYIARQVFVQIGRRSDQRIEITSGLKAGDQIVTSGQNRIVSGDRVRIDNSVDLSAPSIGE